MCIVRAATAVMLLLLLSGGLSAANASTPNAWVEDTEAVLPGWKTYSNAAAGNGNGSRIHVRADNEHRAMLLMIPGSVCTPIFKEVVVDGRKGVVATAPVLNERQQRALGVHIALLERRGMKSFEQTGVSGCTDSSGGVTLQHRTSDVAEQASFLSTLPEVDGLLIAGMSEGAAVATAVAVELGDVAKGVLSMGGSGTSQLFDLLEIARSKGDDATKAYFGELRQLVDGELEGSYLGYPVERWQSFGVGSAPYQSWSKFSVPLMVVHGTEDTSVPIASVDAGIIELLRQQPGRRLYFWSLPDVGHDFASGQDGLKLMAEVIAEFVTWVESGAQAKLRHERPTGT